MEAEDWAKASVPYGDYSGTAAADHWIVNDKGFSAIPGLDLERYQVVGVSLGATEHVSDVHLALLDREKYGDKPADELAKEHGGVPVTDMLLHDFTIESFLKIVMNQAEFTLVHRGMAGHKLKLDELADLPLQE